MKANVLQLKTVNLYLILANLEVLLNLFYLLILNVYIDELKSAVEAQFAIIHFRSQCL